MTGFEFRFANMAATGLLFAAAVIIGRGGDMPLAYCAAAGAGLTLAALIKSAWGEP